MMWTFLVSYVCGQILVLFFLREKLDMIFISAHWRRLILQQHTFPIDPSLSTLWTRPHQVNNTLFHVEELIVLPERSTNTSSFSLSKQNSKSRNDLQDFFPSISPIAVSGSNQVFCRLDFICLLFRPVQLEERAKVLSQYSCMHRWKCS